MRVFLTRETKKVIKRLSGRFGRDTLAVIAFGIGVLGPVLSPAVAQKAEKTGEITSNEIWFLQGNGDSLWMGTALGVNFTYDAFQATREGFSWNGYYIDEIRDSGVYAFEQGGGEAVISLGSSENSYKNKILKITSHGVKSFSLGYSTNIDDPEKQPDFRTVDIAYDGEGVFWLANQDGGIVRHTEEDTVFHVFFPGLDTTALGFGQVGDGLKEFMKPEHRVVGLDLAESSAGESFFIAACEEALWEFKPADTVWTLITDTATIVDTKKQPPDTLPPVKYGQVMIRDSATFFATRVDPKGDTALYKFEKDEDQRWVGSEFLEQNPRAIAFIGDSLLYVVHDNTLRLYADDSTEARSIPFKDGRSFGALRLDLDMLDPFITDLVYTTYTDTTALWIATTEGLILAASEDFAPDSLPDFEYIRREKPIKAGLDEVYAVPSIINENPRNNQAVFAYNLGKDDHVTIDVYDWNMDHVVRVISNQFRKAGVGSGRSTVRAEDNWDGYLPGGKPAAPGVYYFKITTNKNGRAFGKLIVARTR